jgi:hypothetical protein
MTYRNDDDAFDENGILRDGHTVRVPLQMRDAMRRASNMRDGGHHRLERDPYARHRPGQRFGDMAALDAKERAYREYEQRQCDAWKAREGDLCTINGAPAHLNAQLECVPDRREKPSRIDSTPTNDARAEAYAAYDREMSNAWRGSGQ